jgi:DNA polymerase-3 subunit epsilon
VAATARLAEQAQVLAGSDVQRELPLPGDARVQAVAGGHQPAGRQRAALKADVDERVRRPRRDIDAERSRLAALMAELTQSVVVCNLDGRILLYNSRARLQFRALSTPRGRPVGPSCWARPLDLRRVRPPAGGACAGRRAAAAAARCAHPSAQFVTSTRGGQLLRVQMAPVRAMDDSHDGPVLTGFVLMLDNITRDFADESERDRMLHQLTETSRASLGNLQAAVELLDDPDARCRHARALPGRGARRGRRP